jgi:hypothetical protein
MKGQNAGDFARERLLKKSKNRQQSLITTIKIDYRDYFIDEKNLCNLL